VGGVVLRSVGRRHPIRDPLRQPRHGRVDDLPYQRAGFRRIGVRRGARISREQPTDAVLMDAVPQDFGAAVLR